DSDDTILSKTSVRKPCDNPMVYGGTRSGTALGTVPNLRTNRGQQANTGPPHYYQMVCDRTRYHPHRPDGRPSASKAADHNGGQRCLVHSIPTGSGNLRGARAIPSSFPKWSVQPTYR